MGLESRVVVVTTEWMEENWIPLSHAVIFLDLSTVPTSRVANYICHLRDKLIPKNSLRNLWKVKCREIEIAKQIRPVADRGRATSRPLALGQDWPKDS